MDGSFQAPGRLTELHPLAADELRQGEIIPEHPWQRRVFVTGLAAAVQLALLLLAWAYWPSA